ncbi:hypothetical protein DPSP01_001139 [Paraphaeosphaeria sporulosa]|uniref:Putative hydroxybutyrate dehydrogenase n=1 Tax=Paraphaeosphaeria sporulosa TaxID=1460663 RepID=A0A177C5P1_9PLEO|nr:putative hydroxybutyrate dehydrogenase [Paraphaeosphaeria sporulosa]OAG02000.1 putative hydroxybutyrate dehydrogenase [Paraphaeosphaeria sporulosa]
MAKAVLITGCSDGGIGHALAKSFAQRGLTVFATARLVSNITGFEQFPSIHLLQLDVIDPNSIKAAVEAVEARSGRLDYLVNNAGRGYFMPAMGADIEESKKVYEVNFWGPLRTTQAFMPLLIASKGSIVNIGSIVGYFSQPYIGIYSASKAALHSLSDIMRVELAPFSVKVLTVVTGSIKTALHGKLPPCQLPEGSIYAPIQQQLDIMAHSDSIVRSEAEPYAEAVVSDVLAGKTGRVWHGSNSWKTKAGKILPKRVQDRILCKGAGLERLA